MTASERKRAKLTRFMLQKLVKLLIERAWIIRGGIGIQMAILSTLTFVAIPTHAFNYNKATGEYLDASNTQVLTTTSTYLYPVLSPLNVSQEYGIFHRGIDIRAPMGSPVVAIDNGTVVEVREQSFGYGKHIRIAHNGTMSSLYAHLSKIEVKVGERVMAGQEIGKIGITGWSTGPHLHFEMMNGLETINPAEMVRKSV